MSTIYEENNTPNPGSAAALELGCECPVRDNHYGRGINYGDGEYVFWINGRCPVHGLPLKEKR